jgi:hypothetical protein
VRSEVAQEEEEKKGEVRTMYKGYNQFENLEGNNKFEEILKGLCI